MVMQRAEQLAADGYIPLMARLKAWWDGNSTAVAQSTGSSPIAASGIVVDAHHGDEPLPNWPPERVAIVQQLWGEASTRPGGPGHTVDLLRPLNILPEMTVLDLAAGLAGDTRAASKEFDAWITAMECDPDLAALADDRRSERVSISHFDPQQFELPTAKFNCIYAREQLCFLPDRHLALAKICNALKPYGQVLLTDFAAKSKTGGNTLTAWQSQHPLPEPLWTPKEYRQHFADLDMDIRVFQDDSDQFKSLILEGWSRFVNDLTRPQLTRSFVDSMVVEADRWLHTVRALDAGELRLLRVHAMAKGKIF